MAASSSVPQPPPPNSVGTPASTKPDDFRSSKLSATKASSSLASLARAAKIGPTSRAICTASNEVGVASLVAAAAVIGLSLCCPKIVPHHDLGTAPPSSPGTVLHAPAHLHG